MKWVYIVGFGANIGAAATRAIQDDGIGTGIWLTAAAVNLALLRLDQRAVARHRAGRRPVGRDQRPRRSPRSDAPEDARP